MTGFEHSLVVIFGLWLGALTVVVVLLAKQAVLLTGRMTSISDIANGSNYIGLPIPRRTEELVHGGLGDVDVYAVVILSLTCTPCRVVLHDTVNWPARMPVVMVLDGRDNDAYEEFKTRVPSRMFVVPLELRTHLTDIFPTAARPFGALVSGGVVVSAGPITNPKQFVEGWEEFEFHLDHNHAFRTRDHLERT